MGIMGITICYTAVTILIRTPLVIYISSRSGPVGIMDQVKCFTPTIMLSAIMVVIIKLTLHYSKITSDIITIIIAIGIYILCFVGAFILSKNWRKKICTLLELLSNKAGIKLPKIFEYK